MDWHTRLPSRVEDVAAGFIPDGPFVALLALNATEVSTGVVAAAVRDLLDRGMHTLSVWGPGCERVHDIADEVIAHPDTSDAAGRPVLTTWHAEESVDEVADFLERELASEPDVRVMVFVVGDRDWSVPVADALRERFRHASLASAERCASSLAGASLERVAYIGFAGEDPVCITDSAARATHHAEMGVELWLRGGRVVRLEWTNQTGRFGDYELDVREGATSGVVDAEPPPSVWTDTPALWPAADSEDSTFRRWDVGAHPFWAPHLNRTIRAVRVRTFPDGIWDLRLDLDGHSVFFFCWGVDVVYVSTDERPLSGEDPVSLTTVDQAPPSAGTAPG